MYHQYRSKSDEVTAWSLLGFQWIALIVAGLLLGSTWSQSIGIMCALYCLMPAVAVKA